MSVLDKWKFEARGGHGCSNSDYLLQRTTCCGSFAAEDDELSDLYIDPDDLNRSITRARVCVACNENGITYPPARLVLAGFKQERRLEVYAGSTSGPLRLIRSYPILAASGALGPKLREGDRQVPEGVYKLESLNPNSRFHAALRVAYPNQLDASLARRDGRTQLGGDIMIHGGAASVGCLAIGDRAIEDLFVLAAEVGVEKVTIVLSPVDLRAVPLPAELNGVDEARYSEIRSALSGLER